MSSPIKQNPTERDNETSRFKLARRMWLLCIAAATLLAITLRRLRGPASTLNLSPRKPKKNAALATWLDRDDRELVDAIVIEIRQHVAKLHARGTRFYGYAILPGVSCSIGGLVAAYNRESDIAPKNLADNYYRYSVVEWATYEHDDFPVSDQLIEYRNTQFQEMHIDKKPDDFAMDEFEIAHKEKLLDTILTAMKELHREGTIGGDKSYAVIWIPDSDESIMHESAKALNSSAVYEAFKKEFGDGEA